MLVSPSGRTLSTSLSIGHVFIERGTPISSYISIPVINPKTYTIRLPKGYRLAVVETMPDQELPTAVEARIAALNSPEEEITPERLKGNELRKRVNGVIKRLPINIGKFSTDMRNEIKAIIADKIEAFPDDSDFPGVSTKLPPMKIETTGPPIKSKPYKTTPEDRAFLQATINRLLESGCISPSNSPWSFPVLVARHRSGKLRMCVNYKRLNAVTRKDSYPLPNIQDLLNNLGGNAYYSTLDLCQGFHQCQLSEERDEDGFSSRDKSSMVTPFGTYQWNVVGFGMSNAPSHFSRCMDMVLSGLHWSICCVFIDDLVIFSKTFKQHCRDLRTVLQRLIDFEVKVKPEKCHLFTDSVQYLGHTLTRDGIEPIQARIEAISKIQPSKTLTELRSFVATCQYYRRFIRDFAKIAAPLYELTKKEKQPFKGWEPNSKEDIAFHALKKAMSSAPLLKLPNYQKPYFISVDASGHGFGAVLEQDFVGPDGKVRRHPIHFASRRVSPREAKLHSTHREASAVVWALHYFRYYIQGLPTTVYTDHGPLTWLMSTEFKNTPLAKYAARLQEWQKDVTIKYKPGRVHGNADGPSRLPVDIQNDVEDTDDIIVPDSYVCSLLRLNNDPTKPAWIKVFDKAITKHSKLDTIRKAQIEEPSARRLIDYLTASPDFDFQSSREMKVLQDARKHYKVQNGLLYRVAKFRRNPKAPEEEVEQLYLPAKCRRRVLAALHDHPTSAHIGKEKMLALIQRRYYWPNYTQEIADWVATCPLCQRYKALKRKDTGLLHPKQLQGPFHTLCVDIVSGFPTYRGYKYVLTMVDTFTRWVHLAPLKDKTKETVADAIYHHVIINHGCVRRILSDQGGEFENEVLDRLCQRCGIKKHRTSPQHPQSNSQPERIHRHLPKSLGILAQTHPTGWPFLLPNLEFAYRTSPISGLGFSAFESLYARSPVLPIDILTSDEVSLRVDKEKYQLEHTRRMKEMWDLVKRQSEALQEKQKRYHDAKAKPAEFATGSSVLLYRPSQEPGPRKLESPWQGPFTVLGLRGLSDRTYRLERDDDGTEFLADVTDLVPYQPHRRPGYEPEPEDTPQERQPAKEANLDGEEGEIRLPSAALDSPNDPEFLEMNRSEQGDIIKEAIEVINQLNPWVTIGKSSIKPISRRYPYGAFAKRDIPTGTCLGQYKGETISKEERQRRYPHGDDRYVFGLPNGRYVDAVDPRRANFARFVNCTGEGEEPNLEVIQDKGQLYLVTIRDVEKGDELVYDYGSTYEWARGERGIRVPPEKGGQNPEQGDRLASPNEKPGTPTSPNEGEDRKHGQDGDVTRPIEKPGTTDTPMGAQSRPHERDDTVSSSTNRPKDPTTDHQAEDKCDRLPEHQDNLVRGCGVPKDPSDAEEKNGSPRTAADAQPPQVPERTPLTREKKRYSHETMTLTELDEGSMVAYRDDQAGDAPEEWSLGSVEGIDEKRNVIEVHRYGSYVYLRDPSTSTRATWSPRYIDCLDNKEVFTLRPLKKHHPVLVHVPERDILAHSFHLTNARKIPPPVLELILDQSESPPRGRRGK